MQGRLHTCYSPVRRSPAAEASFSPAAPRLACVKPVASVHPEPGSNSPLLFILFSSFLYLKAARYKLNLFLPSQGKTIAVPSASVALSNELSHFIELRRRIDSRLRIVPCGTAFALVLLISLL